MNKSQFQRNYVVTGFVLSVFLIGSVFAGRSIWGGTEGPVAYASDANTLGPVDAPVQIVEYSDFQCPACAFAQEPLKDILKKYEGSVHLVYRHFPLSGHQWSGVAHQTAQCAAQQGKFWQFHDKLFETQKVWSGPENPTKRFVQYAEDLGLDLDALAACMVSDEVREEIMEQKKEGLDRQVRSTPTFFVNGELLVGRNDLLKRAPEIIEAAIKDAEK